MAENSRVHAPYNFVPFSSKVLIPYESVRDLPRHDELRTDLKSGEIQVTLQAETPVFVSDGDPKKQKDPHFFRGANGKYMIPGSTVRGMARENMQILGFGIIRPGEDLEDYQIFFRKIVSGKDSVGAYYRRVLKISDYQGDDRRKHRSVPQNVEAGYLSMENGRYILRPISRPVLPVSRKMPDVQQFGPQNARVVPVAYQVLGNRVTKILPVDQCAANMQRGNLLYTGKAVQENHLYLFPEPNMTVEPVAELEASHQDILSYQADLENRANSLQRYDLNFWKLPEEGQNKPVFYLRYQQHLYFGMTRFLRIGYQNPISAGLPLIHRNADVTNALLDYPHAILGFATETGSYRSRVSFGDFHAVGLPREMKEIRAILSSPKPSYYPGYVIPKQMGKDSAARAMSYNDDGFQLRGYKQYWLKPVQTTEGRPNVDSLLRPLPKGTEFQGVIRFKNLTDMELGLLLWSLQLEKGCCQNIGMGKPYGYGRLRVRITTLRLLNLDWLYSSDLTTDYWKDETEQVSHYIDAYDREALKFDIGQGMQSRVRDQEEIQDFFFIKSSIRDGKNEVYMTFPEYRRAREPLAMIHELRKNTKE